MSYVVDKCPKVVLPEKDQNKNAVLNDSSMSEKNSDAKGSITENGRLKGLFCSKTVFNLSKKILNETEIRVLEKGLDLAQIQKTCMRCKWNFRNEPTNNFSETPAFIPKSGWKPHKGHASFEVFLSSVEKELFSNEMKVSTKSNLSGEKWKA